MIGWGAHLAFSGWARVGRKEGVAGDWEEAGRH